MTTYARAGLPDTSDTPDSPDTVSLLRDLIQNACVNDGSPDSGQEARNAQRIADYLAGSGAEVVFTEPHPGRVSAVFRVRGTDPAAPALSLIGHTDVVPADEANWTVDPFAAEVIDGAVYGRGAVDMLNLTAAMAVVTRQAATSGRRLRGDLVFAAVADEEAGSRFGMGWITEHRPDLVPAQYALTESGGVHVGSGGPSPAVVLTVGEKGAAPRRLVARGRAGHGSMPWGASNAAVLAAEAVLRLSRHRTRPVVSGLWRQYVTASGFPAEVEARLLAPESLDDELPGFGTAARYAHAVSHLTIAPTLLSAGHKRNVIPGLAEIGLDVRLLPGQDGDTADAEIAAALGDLAEQVEIQGSGYRAGSQSPADGPLFDAVERAVRRRFPRSRLLPALTGGGTDARWVRDRGGTAYGFGLFSEAWGVGEYRSIFHADDEHVDFASLRLTTEALADIVHDFLG